MLLIVLDLGWKYCDHSVPAAGQCGRNKQTERRASCSFLPIGCQIAPSFRPDRDGAEQRLARFPRRRLCAAGAELRYCSSLTFSNQSTALPSSLWLAMRLIAVAGDPLGAAFGV
jgi:hypothetical protein